MRLVWNRLSRPAFECAPDSVLATSTHGVAGSWTWCTGVLRNRAELASAYGLPTGLTSSGLIAALHGGQAVMAASSLLGTATWIHWDESRDELRLARDRLGLHPLYYAESADRTVVVADSARGVADALPGPRRPNRATLAAHICGLPPSDDGTYFDDVRAVLPGAVVTITRATSRSEAYWRLSLGPALIVAGDREYAAAYRALLARVVSGYAASAGRVAVTLSGGLDSTSVAAALSESVPRPDAFAVALTAPDLPAADETSQIRLVATRLGLRTVWLRFDEHWPLQAIDREWTAFDSAFCLPYDDAWRAMHAAARSQGAEVVFAGHGGDELFGGNVFPYLDLLAARRVRDFASALTAHLRARRVGVPLAVAIRALLLQPLSRSLRRGGCAGRTPEPPAWLTPASRSVWRASVPDRPPAATGSPARRQRLVQIGRGEMARNAGHHRRMAASLGVDLRLPLLDHEIVEFALNLPADQAVRGGVRKWIVRNAMRGLLPDAVLDRTDKTYPTAIADRGLKEREVARVWNYLTHMRAADLGLVDERRVREEYQAYLDGTHRSSLFWHTITLEDWLRRYFS